MSIVDEVEIFNNAARIVDNQQIARDLGSGRYLFRDLDTGRFTTSLDIWDTYRRDVEDLSRRGIL